MTGSAATAAGGVYRLELVAEARGGDGVSRGRPAHARERAGHPVAVGEIAAERCGVAPGEMRGEELVHHVPAPHVVMGGARVVVGGHQLAEVEELDLVVAERIVRALAEARHRLGDDLQRDDRLLAAVPVLEHDLVAAARPQHEVVALLAQTQVLVADPAPEAQHAVLALPEQPVDAVALVERDHVAAAAEVEPIVAASAGEEVGVAAPGHSIIAATAVEDRVPVAILQVVVALAALEDVDAVAAAQPVVAVAALDQIVARRPDEAVLVTSADDVPAERRFALAAAAARRRPRTRIRRMPCSPARSVAVTSTWNVLPPAEAGAVPLNCCVAGLNASHAGAPTRRPASRRTRGCRRRRRR